MMQRLVCLTVVVLLGVGAVQAQMLKTAELIEIRLETDHPYGLSDAEVPQLSWSQTLHHPEATHIQPHFAKFHLADGDYMIVRSPDGAQSWRYEGLGRADQGLHPEGFWSPRILGDTAVIELYTQHALAGYGFRIDNYYRGYTDIEMEENNPFYVPPTFEAICGSDNSENAICYADSEPEIYEQARAVARLHIPGSGCTGWLVGCEGHLMTNNHCISSQSGANAVEYEFMGEGATCSTFCQSNGACPGPIVATEATLIRTNSPLDYTLLKLPVNASETYGYMKLRPEGPVLDERIYIPQHPALWGKRISVFSDNGQDQSGFCEVFSLNRPACTGGPGDIGYYCDTQGGSSGSPVLAYSDHRVVSLHHCANCPNRGLNIADVVVHLGDDVPACAVAQLEGLLEIDRDAYSCNDEIEITVVDDSIQGAGQQAITLRSDTEQFEETLLLTEAESGIFVGSFATTGGPPVHGDSLLSLTHEDSLIVTYIDADDGNGGTNVLVEATAVADCAGPGIFNLSTTPLTPGTVLVHWKTDETATRLVTYGETIPGLNTASTPGMDTDHRVQVGGLGTCKLYFFSVSSADELGNLTVDNNDGNYYTISTSCPAPSAIPDGDGDTQPLSVERLTPDGSQLAIDWDAQCSTDDETNLIYGSLDDVSAYTVLGSLCSLTQPTTWDAVPAGNLWFLLVGENTAGIEGSWGSSSAGERGDPAGSLQCGTVGKLAVGGCQ